MSKQQSQQSARILISLPDQFLTDVDKMATDEHRTRSELIREALRFYIKSIDAVGHLSEDEE